MNTSCPRIIAAAVFCLTGSLLLAGYSSGPAQTSNTISALAVAVPWRLFRHLLAPVLSLYARSSPSRRPALRWGRTRVRASRTPSASRPHARTAHHPSILRVDLVPIGGKAGYEHALSIAQAHPVVTINGVGDAAFGTFNGTFGAAEFH